MDIETEVNVLKSNFLIEDPELDLSIKIRIGDAEKIAEETGKEREEIAIILAAIEKSRILACTYNGVCRRISKSKLYDTIVTLLNTYSPGKLINIFEEMKYFQIREVMESDDIMETLECYL